MSQDQGSPSMPMLMEADHMFTPPSAYGVPFPTFMPDTTLGWEIKGVMRGNNGEGFIPGGNVSVACEKGEQRLVVTTSVGSARPHGGTLAVSALERHLRAMGSLPVVVDPFHAILTAADRPLAFEGVRCGDAFVARAVLNDVSLEVQATLTPPEKLRLIVWRTDS